MSDYDELLDASGEACPMPLLKAKMKLNAMSEGRVLKVVATDAGSVRDFDSFIALTAHKMIGSHQDENTFVYYIEKRI